MTVRRGKVLRVRCASRFVPAPRHRGPRVHCVSTLVPVAAAAFLAAGALALPPALHAQLRPLDPVDLSGLGRSGWTVVTGVGGLAGQKASLAGVNGDLLELANMRVAWSLDRVVLELSGTLLRIYDDRETYVDPVGDARPSDGTLRVDAGDLRVSTLVRLDGSDDDTPVALRFGTRLPTTDNRVGLGRDQTDFFATLAARDRWGAWWVAGELGMGINGTRDTGHEQIDPILFAVSAERSEGRWRPVLEATGQHDPRRNRDRRGNENIGEVRVGTRVSLSGSRADAAGGAERPWLSVLFVRGWTSTSPDYGLLVRLGWRW